MHRSAKTKALSALATSKGSLAPDALNELLTILFKVVSNILKKPKDDTVRSLRFGNKTVKNKIACHAGGVDFLLALGFIDIGSGDDRALVLPIGSSKEKDKDSDDISSLKWAQRTLEDMLKGSSSSSSSKAKKAAAPAGSYKDVPGFDPFASNVVRVAPQPRRGQGKTDRALSSLKAKKDKIERAEGIPPRNLMLAPPGAKVDMASVSTTGAGSSAKVGGDGSILLEAAKARMQKQKEASQFRTRSMRELDSLRNSQVFTKILIRVAFPDKLILYAHFAPYELVEDIKRVIMHVLNPALAKEAPDMQLFVTPPRQLLDDSHTLTEAGLYPAALVYLDWAVDTAKTFSNFSYLQPNCAEVVSRGEVFADENAKAAGDKRKKETVGGDPLYPASVPLVKRPTSPTGASASAAGGSSKSKKSTSSSKGVPSWFKR